MANIATTDLHLDVTDLDLDTPGVDLTFRRAYDSLSLHNVSGADGSEPAIFGNYWTNNFDSRIVYRGGSPAVMTVYTLDGTRDDFKADGNGNWISPPGDYDVLEPVPSGSTGAGCGWYLVHPSGSYEYYHNATVGSTNGCNIPPANVGRLYLIVGRNNAWKISFTYSYTASSQQTAEDITKIVVSHSNGQSITLNFDMFGNYNELAEIVRPDNAKIEYKYDTNGNLGEVDKPGNNAATDPANAFIHQAPYNVLPADLPETYTMEYPVLHVCGPRATISKWSGAANDGSCVSFDYVFNYQLIDWYNDGVMNFIPPDGTHTLLDAKASQSWTTWNTTNFSYGVTDSTCPTGPNVPCSEVTDSEGHSTVWNVDSAGRVVQTERSTGTLSLKTTQTWGEDNNLLSYTDANGNETDASYDTYGNVVQLSLPAAPDIACASCSGAIRPTSTYSYGSVGGAGASVYGVTVVNLASYCDPVYNAAHGITWQSQEHSDLLCSGSSGTTRYTYNIQDTGEPAGCLVTTQTPLGYQNAIGYGSGCGNGLPTLVQGEAIAQADGGAGRTPTQDFSYDTNGRLHKYDKGTDTEGDLLQSWTLTYDTASSGASLNRVEFEQENDASINANGIVTHTCYNLDGSVLYKETPSQYIADGKPACPTASALANGPFAAPSNANSFEYDADGDEIQAVTHKSCSAATPCPSDSTSYGCAAGAVAPIGTTCKYYDGLDRLVEVIEPHDSSDYYSFKWMTRYLYDLTESAGASQTGLSIGGVRNVVAYGNLYKTQEWLPSNPIVNDIGSAPTAASWMDVRGNSYDALDRSLEKYETAVSTTAPELTNSYDTSGDLGLLGKTENGEGQITTYAYDPDDRVREMDFSGTKPVADTRTYTYDPNGRVASITSTMGTISYIYDADGRKTQVNEPANEKAASTICYSYYPDGLREYLSLGTACPHGTMASGGVSGQNAFAYSYREDGLLRTQAVNWESAQGAFKWAYTVSGRELTEQDPLTGTKVSVYFRSATPNGTYTYLSKTYTYDSNGRVQTLELPEGYAEGSSGSTGIPFTYDVDDELTGFSLWNHNGFVAGPPSTSGGGNTIYTLNVRGEILAAPSQPSANGLLVGDPANVFDARDNQALGISAVGPNPSGQEVDGSENYIYDSAGRQQTMWFSTSQNQRPVSSPPPSAPFTLTRSYDAENHVISAPAWPPAGSSCLQPNADPIACTVGATFTWGPDGHVREISGMTLHWDGDALLFIGGESALWVGKLGGVSSGSSSGSGGDWEVTDRDQAGTQQAFHTSRLFTPWTMTPLRVGSAKVNGLVGGLAPGSCVPPRQVGSGTPFQCTPYQGPNSVEEFRSDGYSYGSYTFQGVRIFDNTSSQWLTPDPYAGDVHDPMSQKPFMWNNNNPITWADPSGYLINFIGDDTQKQREQADWDAVKDSFSQNSREYQIMDDIEHNPNFTVDFKENSLGDTQFVGTYTNNVKTDIINFDPHAAVQIDEKGDAISPALALLHEADHAERFNTDYSGYANDILHSDLLYDNLEEKRVITGTEAEVLYSKGLPSRTSHTGSVCTVQSLFSWHC